MGEEFVLLFTQMNWVVILLITLGLCLLMVEAAIPGFGIVGTGGILCEIAAIICHGVFSQSVIQVIFLLLILMVATLIIIFIIVHSFKKGYLKRTFVEDRPAIPVDYGDEAKNPLRELLGKQGVLLIDCKPVGKALFNSKAYEVYAKDKMIVKDAKVVVVEVCGEKIYIDAVKEYIESEKASKTEGWNWFDRLKKRKFEKKIKEINHLEKKGDK